MHGADGISIILATAQGCQRFSVKAGTEFIGSLMDINGAFSALPRKVGVNGGIGAVDHFAAPSKLSRKGPAALNTKHPPCQKPKQPGHRAQAVELSRYLAF